MTFFMKIRVKEHIVKNILYDCSLAVVVSKKNFLNLIFVTIRNICLLLLNKFFGVHLVFVLFQNPQNSFYSYALITFCN